MADIQPAESAPKCGIFLSYRSTDRLFVEGLQAQLENWSYQSFFLDAHAELGIPVGADWREELYRNLDANAALIVVWSWNTKESQWVNFETEYANRCGKAIFVVKIDDCPLNELLSRRNFIYWNAKGEEPVPEPLRQGLKLAGLDPAEDFRLSKDRAPYPGFDSFQEEDAGVYFGRSNEIASARKILDEMANGFGPRFALVVGSSGSGKSSLVRAGIVPRLKQKSEGRWCVIPPFRPREKPILALAHALANALKRDIDPRAIYTALSQNAEDAVGNLISYTRELRTVEGRPTATVLLVVDQLEELLVKEPSSEVNAFWDILQGASRVGDKLLVLATLRTDFLARFQAHPKWINQRFELLSLGPMAPSVFPQLIEWPAARAGIRIDSTLVAEIMKDATTPETLPLLAFALREMYRKSAKPRILFTTDLYVSGVKRLQGAVELAVSRLKDQGPLTDDVRRAFFKMVEVNENGEYIRKSLSLDPLPPGARDFMKKAVDERLLAQPAQVGENVVEVAHESLFRAWPELSKILDQSRELLLWKRRIKRDLADWLESGKNPFKVLPTGRLDDAKKWLSDRPDDLEPVEKEFVEASIREAKDQARAKARAARRLRYALYNLALAFATSVVIAAYAATKADEAQQAEKGEKQQRRIAEKARNDALDAAQLARSRELATHSAAEANNRFDRSFLLAVEAFRIKDTFEARERLYNALQERPGLRLFLHISESVIPSLAFSPDGKTLAAGFRHSRNNDYGGVVLWDAATGKRLAYNPFPAGKCAVVGVAFSPDGKTLAIGYVHKGGAGVALWDATAGKGQAGDTLLVPEGAVQCVAFSPDGKTLAAGYGGNNSDGGVLLWDAATHKKLAGRPLSVTGGDVLSVAFGPDNLTLAAGYTHRWGQVDRDLDGGVALWNLNARDKLPNALLRVEEGFVQSVAFSPDGKSLAAGYAHSEGGGGVVLWDTNAHTRLVGSPLLIKEGGVGKSLAFSPDGKTLAAGFSGAANGVARWDLTDGKKLAIDSLAVKEGDVHSLAFSPDGKTLAAGFSANASGVVLWDTVAHRRLAGDPLPVKEGSVWSLSFSPDGKTLAAGYTHHRGGGDLDRDGGVVLWDVATRERLAGGLLTLNFGGAECVAFSPDGKTLAVGFSGATNGVLLWDATVRKGLAADPFLDQDGIVKSVAFSPDGSTLAVGAMLTNGGRVELWDVATRKRLAADPLPVKEGYVLGVAFSPDGKILAAGYSHSGDDGGGVVLWDTTTRTRLADDPLFVKEGDVASNVAFSPGGETLATGFSGASNGVVLWDVAVRERRAEGPLLIPEGNVWSLSFSPDGKTLAVGYAFSKNGNDGVVLLDVATHRRRFHNPLTVNDGRVRTVSFSPDGRTLAAGCAYPKGGVSGVELYDVDPNSWILRAKQIANRNFTREEWKQYFPDEPYRPTFPDLPVPPE